MFFRFLLKVDSLIKIKKRSSDFYANKRHKGSEGHEDEEFSSAASVRMRQSTSTPKTKKNIKEEVSKNILIKNSNFLKIPYPKSKPSPNPNFYLLLIMIFIFQCNILLTFHLECGADRDLNPWPLSCD